MDETSVEEPAPPSTIKILETTTASLVPDIADGADIEGIETEQEGMDTEHDVDPASGEEYQDVTEEEGEMKPDSLTPQQRARHAITGRGVTLSMLMADGVIEPGEDNMSIEYLGQKFTADLLSDGQIRWREEDKIFGSPSAWAIHCKKIVNPMKKSGCGWASVKYKGKKLNSLKSTWTRKQRPISGLAITSSNGKEEGEDSSEGEDFEEKRIKEEAEEEEALTGGVKQDRRASVKHGTLGRKSHLHDPNTLVECISFNALGKIQPFNISVTTNALLLLDLHCHLTTSEVVGYLGGSWDCNTQSISIDIAFPCCSRLGDKDTAEVAEQNIRTSLDQRGLRLVGWYHSHPRSQPDPSLRDLEAQMEYQLQLSTSQSHQPCLAIIVSAHEVRSRLKGNKESSIRVIWVMPPPEQRPLDYGMPIQMQYSMRQDMYLSHDALIEMKTVIDFYKNEPDMIDFSTEWHDNITMLSKLKGSLVKKLPKDQGEIRVLDYIGRLLEQVTPPAVQAADQRTTSVTTAEH